MTLVILLCLTYLASCGKTLNSPDVLDGVDSESELETFKDEEPKDETPKDETPKDETPKDETPKDETPKDETPKDETPKDETPKDETPKDETPKDETPKDETPKDETPKDEPKDEPTEEPKEEEPKVDPDLIVNVTPTNFASVFTPENEELLAKILNTPIQTGVDLEFLLPAMPIAYDVKEPSGNGGYTYVYYNYDKSVYDKCCQTMINANYAQYSKNEISGKAYNNANETVKNYFATFISAKAQVDLEYHESAKRIYIHINARSASVLRQREAQSYVRAGDKFPTIFVQYGLEDIDTGTQTESSMGYIMRLDDGTFLIIDGGEYYDGVETRMYDILKSLAPDPNNIVIAAWILTHGHYDHVGGFMKFADKYATDSTIKVKQVVTNFPDDSNCLNNPERSAHSYVRSATAKLKAETLKPHTGNVLYYADIKINILYTQENYLACNTDGIMKEYNASSIVMQIETAAKTKIFIAADHPVNGSYEGANWCEGALYKWYGTAIQSYVTTTFHHGFGGGADNTIYNVIDARITLWNCDYSRAQEVMDYECNQFFLNRLATSIYKYYGAFGSSVTILSFNNYMAFATIFPNFPTYQTAMHNIYK